MTARARVAASAAVVLGTVAATASPAEAATTTAMYNEGGAPISVACSNPGTVHRVEGYRSYRCAGGDIWLRTACGYQLNQVNFLGVWFSWRPLTGWHRDDDGGQFWSQPDGHGCD